MDEQYLVMLQVFLGDAESNKEYLSLLIIVERMAENCFNLCRHDQSEGKRIFFS